MTERKSARGRLQLLILAAIFFGPLAVAAWMYYHGGLAPDGRTNHGLLLEPIVALADAAPASRLSDVGEGGWLLVYADTGDCADECRNALYVLRQSRLMLGKEMDRLTRVFLHGETAPDTLFLQREHAGLETIGDPGLAGLLQSRKPAAAAPGGYYLVDPHRNLVMYFPPNLDPADMVDDVKHLLRLSRIG